MSSPIRTIAILGAGPAGGACALVAAKAGLSVTLFESKVFPRAKVCGEFVSPAVTGLLESLINPETLIAHGGRRVSGFCLKLNGLETTLPLPSSAWSMGRDVLDRLLLDVAVQAGTRLLAPCAVRSVEYADDHVSVHHANGTDSFDVVIHADGTGRHDPAGATPNAPGWLGFKCRVRLPAGADVGNRVEIRSSSGAYIGVIAVHDGLHTVAIASNHPSLKPTRANLDHFVTSRWPGFHPSMRTDEWLVCGVPRSPPIKPAHPRSFRIGNAGAAVDPIGGEGIGLALWSGVTLSKHIVNSLSTHITLPALQDLMLHSYQQRVARRRLACRLAAELLVRPRLMRIAWPLLTPPIGSLRTWYRLTGKPV